MDVDEEGGRDDEGEEVADVGDAEGLAGDGGGVGLGQWLVGEILHRFYFKYFLKPHLIP